MAKNPPKSAHEKKLKKKQIKNRRYSKPDPEEQKKNTKFRTRKQQKKGRKKGEVDEILTTPENRKRSAPICGADRSGKSTSGPGVCCMPAGWGTDHKGFGQCKLHGGNTPGGIQTAALEEMSMTFRDEPLLGTPIDGIMPGEALLLEVRNSAGICEWLKTVIQELGQESMMEGEDATARLHQFTNLGIQPSVWMQMYQDERRHLVSTAKACHSAGIEERQVELAEGQGAMIAALLQAIAYDTTLALTPEQLINFKEVARKHLSEVPIETTAKELTA